MTGRVFGLLRIASCVGALVWAFNSQQARRPAESLAPHAGIRSFSNLELKAGDVVFRRGRSLNGRAVLMADTASRFSHVGLVTEVLAERDSRVVHALPPESGLGGGVVSSALGEFISQERATDWAVFRLAPSWPSSVAEEAARIATVMAERGLGFDGEFDSLDEREVYCTELVWRAYREAGLDLAQGQFDEVRIPLLGKAQVILPSRLQNSPYLRRITRPPGDEEES